MSTSELDTYELLKLKLGEEETKALFSFVESKVNDQQDNLATKLDQLATKLDLAKVKAELLVIKWMLGVVLAGIISLVLMMLNLMLSKAFFV